MQIVNANWSQPVSTMAVAFLEHPIMLGEPAMASTVNQWRRQVIQGHLEGRTLLELKSEGGEDTVLQSRGGYPLLDSKKNIKNMAIVIQVQTSPSSAKQENPRTMKEH